MASPDRREGQKERVLIRGVELDHRNSWFIYNAAQMAMGSVGLGRIQIFMQGQKTNPDYGAYGIRDPYDPNIFVYDIEFDSLETKKAFEGLVADVQEFMKDKDYSITSAAKGMINARALETARGISSK